MEINIVKRIVTTFLLLASAAGLAAAPITFNFKDPKGVNTVIFKTDAPLESINGTANGVSGSVTFDPASPADVKGKLVVAASSLHVPNPTMKEHLQGDGWLDVKKHPEITFEVGSTKNAKTEGNATTLDVTGNMTIKGVTKSITVPVKLTYLKDKLKARGGSNKDGDLLVLRANFSVKRSDYGINAAKFEEKVSNDIELTFSLAGIAPHP
jgi:polyisoprenoid-binding protein YceI